MSQPPNSISIISPIFAQLNSVQRSSTSHARRAIIEHLIIPFTAYRYSRWNDPFVAPFIINRIHQHVCWQCNPMQCNFTGAGKWAISTFINIHDVHSSSKSRNLGSWLEDIFRILLPFAWRRAWCNDHFAVTPLQRLPMLEIWPGRPR